MQHRQHLTQRISGRSGEHIPGAIQRGVAGTGQRPEVRREAGDPGGIPVGPGDAQQREQHGVALIRIGDRVRVDLLPHALIERGIGVADQVHGQQVDGRGALGNAAEFVEQAFAVALQPGDGEGPQLQGHAVAVVEATGVGDNQFQRITAEAEVDEPAGAIVQGVGGGAVDVHAEQQLAGRGGSVRAHEELEFEQLRTHGRQLWGARE